MTLATLQQAKAWVAGVFCARGVAGDVAKSVAAALVEAEADGHVGHGLTRIPTYLSMVAAGKIDGQARPVLSRPRPGTLAVDAAHGFAYPALDLACAELPVLARQQGIAAAAIFRSSHAGAIGRYVERLADAGLVSLFFANTPEAMAPWGGRKAIFGTNPIAFGAPCPGRKPVVVDMALSEVARGRIVVAKQKGESIPLGWAFDAEGRPTTDATAAVAGTMAPAGGAKGAALALMVEVLAAALTGANLSFQASSFLDASGPPPATGQFVIGIAPDAFGGTGFAERMGVLAAAIEQQEGARLPGSRRYALRARAEKNGIAVPQYLRTDFGEDGLT